MCFQFGYKVVSIVEYALSKNDVRLATAIKSAKMKNSGSDLIIYNEECDVYTI